MPTISIITAVKAEKDDHLAAVYESLLAQQLPAGWDWEWVLQEDGETGTPFAKVPNDDPRISTGTAPWGRAARARTIAMSRVSGELIRAVDADDVLMNGALWRDVDVLMTHPEIAWCVSPAIDLLEDGSTRPGPRDPNSGPLAAGALADGERAGLLQVLGATMCTYTELVHLLGGWPPLPAEDVGLLLAAEAVSPGWMLAEPGMLYRRWHKAAGYGRDKRVASPDTPARAVMLAHADALRNAGWRWKPTRAATATVL